MERSKGLYLVGTGTGVTPVISPKHLEKEPASGVGVEVVPIGDKLWFSTSGGSLDSVFCRNYTDFSTLTFNVFSRCADGAKVIIRLTNRDGVRRITQARTAYFEFSFIRSFTGEERITLDLDYYIAKRGTFFPTTAYIDKIEIEVQATKDNPDPLPVAFDTPTLEGPIYRLAGGEPTEEDFENLRKRILSSYCGDPTPSELMLPQYRERLKAIDERCRDSMTRFLTTYDGTRGSAYGLDVKLERWQEMHITTLYDNILKMAVGYGARGSEFYKDQELLKVILTALDYGYDNYYGECVMTEGWFGNWWHWEIGIPLSLSPTLLIISPDVDKKLLEKYMAPMDYMVPKPTMTACNKIWLARTVMNSALIRRDALTLVKTRDSLLDMFPYVERGDGMYTDGSFIQHGAHSYAGGYGLGFISMIANLCYALGGTLFDFVDPVVDNHYKWIFDNYVSVTYKGRLFNATSGREVSRAVTEEGKLRNLLCSLIVISEYAPQPLAAELCGFIAYTMEVGGIDPIKDVGLPFVSPTLTIKTLGSEYAKYEKMNELHRSLGMKEIPIPVSYTEYKTPDSTHVFGRMDRVVRKCEKYSACVAMSSNRITKFEPMNLENMDGWYQGEGVLYLYPGYHSGKGGYDHGHDFYGFTSPYRLPGITVNSVKRPYAENYNGGVPLAGGVESGRFGSAIFRLEYGAYSPAFPTDIRANKSYFFFDREIVCLGSDICDTSGTDTVTVMESRYLESVAWKNGIRKVKSQQLVNEGRVEGNKERPADTFVGCKQLFTVNNENAVPTLESRAFTPETVANFDTLGGYALSLEGVGGYIVPTLDGKVQSLNLRLRDNVNIFLEMTLEHGSCPDGERYAYLLLPEEDGEGTCAYAEEMKKGDGDTVRILALKDKLHAVKKTVDGVTYIGVNAFDAARLTAREASGSEEGAIALSTAHPCALFISAAKAEDTVELKVCFADPTRARKIGLVTVNPHLLLPELIPSGAALTEIRQGKSSTQPGDVKPAEILPGLGKIEVGLPWYGATITDLPLTADRASADNDLCGYDCTTAVTPTPYCRGNAIAEGSVFLTADQSLTLNPDLNTNFGDTKSVTLVYKL